MTVVLVDPRRPSLGPVEAIELLTGEVQYTEELPVAVPLPAVEAAIAVPLPATDALNAVCASACGTSAIFSGSSTGLRNSLGASVIGSTGLPSLKLTRCTMTVSPFFVALKTPSLMLIGILPATSLGCSGTKPTSRPFFTQRKGG